MVSTHEVTVDGRRLRYELAGAEDGTPVLFLHGSPGCRMSNRPDDAWLTDAGVLYITYDRPGYGRSDPHPGRRVADCVPDVRAILKDAGIDRVAAFGRSGGGPHALALATLLPDKCTTVAALVSPAPKVDGLDWYAGMDPENVRRYQVAERGAEELREELEPDLARIVAQCKADPVTTWDPMALPDVDLAIIALGGSAALPALQEAAHQGATGFTEDYFAFVHPWGFDPRDVVSPLILQYGGLDVNIPPAHTEWLIEHLPKDSTTVLYDASAGHAMHPDTHKQLILDLAQTVRSRSVTSAAPEPVRQSAAGNADVTPVSSVPQRVQKTTAARSSPAR